MAESEKTEEIAEGAPEPKLTRAEFVTLLDRLIAEGEAAGLPTAQIIASKVARDGTRRITSVLDDFLDGIVGGR